MHVRIELPVSKDESPETRRAARREQPDGESGWFFTGDIGYMDEEGFFHISDRKKDMIIAGGYNIYPAEVEESLGKVAGVTTYMLAGAPDDLLGEVVWAFVVPETPSWSAGSFLLEGRRKLPAHMVPRRVFTVGELPLTGIGEVELRSEED